VQPPAASSNAPIGNIRESMAAPNPSGGLALDAVSCRFQQFFMIYTRAAIASHNGQSAAK
jgi:hypothetical protein